MQFKEKMIKARVFTISLEVSNLNRLINKLESCIIDKKYINKLFIIIKIITL